ncbi:MAG: energy transducer TonB, partial [Bacteroidales bacterium]|nr:energy transducer TonB [Bacteroidales bacterium]
IVYPEAARENNIQGRVFIRFCVTATGEIGQVEVLRGVDPEIDAEAVRAVRTIRGFRPGKQGGVAVPVWYQLPINFKLEN